MVSRFEYHGKESLMEKRRQRRKEQLRNRTVALAAGLLLAGVCGVSSALAAYWGFGRVRCGGRPAGYRLVERRAFQPCSC